MEILGKRLLLFVVVCYVSTAFGKESNVKGAVVEQAAHIKDNVVDTVFDGMKTGAKIASDAEKTAGDYVADTAAKLTKEHVAAQKTQEVYNAYLAPTAAAGAETVKVCVSGYVVLAFFLFISLLHFFLFH